MKKHIFFVTSAILIGLATAPVAFAAPYRNGAGEHRAQRTQADSSARAVFAANSNGGPELTEALEALLAGNPSCSAEGLALVGDIVAEARSVNLDQKIAAGRALLKMQTGAASSGDRDCAKKIDAAVKSADTQTLAAYQA